MCRGSAECGGGVEEVQRRCRGGVEECRGSVEGVQRGGATSPCAEHHCMWCGVCAIYARCAPVPPCRACGYDEHAMHMQCICNAYAMHMQ